MEKIKDKLHTYDRFIQKKEWKICMIHMEKIKDKLQHIW